MSSFPRGGRAEDGRGTHRPFRLVPATALVLLTAAACGSGAGEQSADRAEARPVVIAVDDPYAQADMAALSSASATVVRGTVTHAEPGLQFGDPRDQLRYTRYTVSVDEVLGGTAGDEVEVVMSTHAGRRPATVEGRPMVQVGDQAVWFLTPIAPESGTDGYVLTGQSGLLVLEGDEVTGGGTDDAAVHAEVERLGSAEAVVDHVRAVAE